MLLEFNHQIKQDIVTTKAETQIIPDNLAQGNSTCLCIISMGGLLSRVWWGVLDRKRRRVETEIGLICKTCKNKIG